MILFTKMTKIYDKTIIRNQISRPEFDVGDFWTILGCNVSSRKLLKLNGTPESLPTAWGLIEKTVKQ